MAYRVKVHPKLPILFLNFESAVEMNRALMRAQDFVEHPKMQGTIMSHSRLKDFYGRHPYKAAWGLNIPGKAYLDFCERANLSVHEADLYNHLKEFFPADRNFYILAICKIFKDKHIADKHELAHALYALCPDYKEQVDAFINASPMKKDGLGVIKKWGIYAPSVWQDEFHAYIATDTNDELVNHFHILTTSKECKDLRRDLVDLFNKYYLRYELEKECSRDF